MNRWLLGLLIAGLLIAGALVAASVEGRVGDVAGAFLCSGVTLFLLIVMAYVVVVLASAFRRPTEAQLRAQRLESPRTWHFRPAGLLTFLAAIGGAIGPGLWLRDRFPELGDGARLFTYAVALLIAASTSFRRVRDFLFYTREQGEASRADEGSPEDQSAS
jgi:hypothetical protein